jgi:dipeptidyl aminopeptidase/acylaminoacyl peptidase
MNTKVLTPIFLIAAISAFAQSQPATKRAFTFEDMMALKRISEPMPSPDGKWVVFAAEDVNLEANTKTSHLWIVPAAGGEARRLNQTPNGEERPRFSPDGNRIIFTSKATDPTQVWMCDFNSNAGAILGKPHQVTNISTGADGAIWSPDGKNILFVSQVFPEARGDAENKRRTEELAKSKVKARIFPRLFYRHWNAYNEFKRSHLFVMSANANPAPARDLTPGNHDVPPFSLGGQDMYAISPDGQELAYTSNVDEVEATSTNNEIFIVPLAGGTPRKISTSPGSDSTPLYSRDGRFLAWRSQARAGYEADKFSLMICDRMTGEVRDATRNFDRAVGSFAWLSDSKTILFSAEDHGESPIFTLPSGGGPPVEIVRLHADDLTFGPNDNLYFTRMSLMAANEIWRISPRKIAGAVEPSQITHANDAVLSQINMQPIEPFTFKGANDEDVQGFMIKPPGFDASKRYPLKFLIHGGPQAAWGNSWTYRWNAELFAANGYVIVMINFHGSTGYGQKFTDSIQGDWGGKPYIDLMKGLDYVEKNYPFIDRNREAAMGASYGGYMANWILGHSNRFKCIVSHDGTFNTESAYGTTEELWFIEWEFKGPPWQNRELYRKWSPHLSADKFKTPTLVVHGQLDYRLDVSEGLQLFTTLQRLKVPSKMLYFPDEGHWVLKPQNSRLWYKTVNDWVDQWCGAK